MKYKIDPLIYENVKILNDTNVMLECIVYANNFKSTKNNLKNILKNSEIIEYPFMLAFGVIVNQTQLSEIAQLAEVSYISSNLKVKTMMNVSRDILNIEHLPFKFTKKPKFTVAVIDTGVDTVLDLCVPQNRIHYFEDFINNEPLPYDDNGHGTFITSVLAGNGLVSGGKYAGINSKAHIISLKALDGKGETGAIKILEAMQWVYDNRKKFNIKVVCMSFGSETITKRDPLIIGAEVLWNAGVCVVSAAGNSGPESESIKSPGASSKIITVGAINDNRLENNEFSNENFTIASFSSRGPALGNYKPDVVAPGVNITSACNFSISKNHYSKMSGTSVATPMVAGVCSLLFSYNINLTPNEVKRIIISNTSKVTGDRNMEGYGLVNCNFLKQLNIY